MKNYQAPLSDEKPKNLAAVLPIEIDSQVQYIIINLI